MSITIKLDLPDALAEEARATGVLQAQRLTAIIEEAVERDEQAREFVTLLDKIRSLPGEPLSMEEIKPRWMRFVKLACAVMLVVNTNLLVSATLWHGALSRLIDAIEHRRADLVLSADLLAEFGELRTDHRRS